MLWAFAEGAIAGGAAGLVVEAALYPIDTIKTRLQVALYVERLLPHWTVNFRLLEVLSLKFLVPNIVRIISSS